MSNKSIVWAVVIIIIIGGGWYWYSGAGSTKDSSAKMTTEEPAMEQASYPYECDEHVMFNMSMSGDASTMTIVAANGGAYPAQTTLTKVTSSSGAKYEGGGYTFFGKGESVTLTEGGQSLNCSPVPSQDSAPFNFGD